MEMANRPLVGYNQSPLILLLGDLVSESLEASVTVLAMQVEFLAREFREYREQTIQVTREYREDTALHAKEVDVKLSQMQRSLDMAKGGWIVLTIIGTASFAILGFFTNFFKAFHI